MSLKKLTVFLLLSRVVSIYVVGAACGDDRDKMIKEYVDAGLVFVPHCNDFTQNGHANHFTFKELNTGDYSWAILRDKMLKGIDDLRANYGGALGINSGYRNPVHNSKISDAAKNSKHTTGEAIDFGSDESSWNLIQKAGKKAGACSEPPELSGWGHVHVDWRGACPANW